MSARFVSRVDATLAGLNDRANLGMGHPRGDVMRSRNATRVLAAAVLALLIIPAAAEARGGVILFEDVGFRGGSVRIDRDISNLNALGVNDAASSMSVRGGAWQICEDADYRGRCVVVDGDVADFRKLGLNDRISSIRRVDDRREDRGGYGGGGYDGGGYDRPGRGSGLTVFENVNFSGGNMSFNDDVPDLTALGINDQISSLSVDGGVWAVCEDIRYRGRCITVDRDMSDLGRLGFNDRISSIRRLR
jgi:hypothetical protein